MLVRGCIRLRLAKKQIPALVRHVAKAHFIQSVCWFCSRLNKNIGATNQIWVDIVRLFDNRFTIAIERENPSSCFRIVRDAYDDNSYTGVVAG